jgi:hypothetical protein
LVLDPDGGRLSRSVHPDSQIDEGVAIFDVLSKAHDPVTLFGIMGTEPRSSVPLRVAWSSWSVTFEFLPHLVGDPISTNHFFTHP